MLVTFSCKDHENVTLFGDVTINLLHLMGNSGIVPGAILADDVPDALAHLQQAIEQEKKKPRTSSDDEDNEPEVSLVHRAIPLIALLQDAVTHHCNVMWDKGSSN